MKGILFDFDDTLGNRNLYAYKTVELLIDTFCEINDPFEKECVIQDCMLWDMKGNYNKEFLLENLKKKYHLSFPIDNLTDWWLAHQPAFAVCFDGVEDVLVELKKKYKLAIVTNGRISCQMDKIKRTNIDSYFDSIVISEQVVKKPKKEIYEKAINDLGLGAEDVVFVGDTFSTDIIGAHRAGMEAIWITPFQQPCSANIRQIRHIKELLEIL